MATVTKQTETVNIYLNDDGGGQVTWKLNNPKTGLTAAQIENALAGLFASTNNLGINLLKRNSDYQIVGFERAEYETIIKRTDTIS